jgi:integrase
MALGHQLARGLGVGGDQFPIAVLDAAVEVAIRSSNAPARARAARLVALGDRHLRSAVDEPAKLSKAIDAYLRVRASHQFADSPRVWIGSQGPLTGDGIRALLGRRGTQAGVPGLHAHQFRHTAAHDWLANGGQEGELMKIMGWRARQMVDRYGSSAASERAHESHKRLARGDRV